MKVFNSYDLAVWNICGICIILLCNPITHLAVPNICTSCIILLCKLIEVLSVSRLPVGHNFALWNNLSVLNRPTWVMAKTITTTKVSSRSISLETVHIHAVFAEVTRISWKLVFPQNQSCSIWQLFWQLSGNFFFPQNFSHFSH